MLGWRILQVSAPKYIAINRDQPSFGIVDVEERLNNASSVAAIVYVLKTFKNLAANPASFI
jgi:hypothetical protein